MHHPHARSNPKQVTKLLVPSEASYQVISAHGGGDCIFQVTKLPSYQVISFLHRHIGLRPSSALVLWNTALKRAVALCQMRAVNCDPRRQSGKIGQRGKCGPTSCAQEANLGFPNHWRNGVSDPLRSLIFSLSFPYLSLIFPLSFQMGFLNIESKKFTPR